MLTKLASEVRKDLVTIFQLDTKVARRQHFDDPALKLYVFLATH